MNLWIIKFQLFLLDMKTTISKKKDSVAADSAPPPSEEPEINVPDISDMRHYNELLSGVPQECASVPLILHCLVEQVIPRFVRIFEINGFYWTKISVQIRQIVLESLICVIYINIKKTLNFFLISKVLLFVVCFISLIINWKVQLRTVAK